MAVSWSVCGVRGAVGSIRYMRVDAWRMCRWASCIPRFSIVSVVLRSPAVSVIRIRCPPIVIVVCIASRVVPGIWDTIAIGSPASALISVDFPAFGAPAIVVGCPLRIACPWAYVSARDCIVSRVFCESRRSVSRSANVTSSSEKSSSSSRSDASWIRFWRSVSSCCENFPFVC